MAQNAPLTTAAYAILLVLADGERHGYAIMKEALRLTSGALRLGPGTLYRSLKQLLDGGSIEEMDAAGHDPSGERRRLYRITRGGRAAAIAESRRLERLVVAARAARLLPGGAAVAGGESRSAGARG